MATPKSATELFDELMPAAIAKSPDKAKEVGAIYLFKITGENGGEWTVDLKSDTPSVTKGGQAAAKPAGEGATAPGHHHHGSSVHPAVNCTIEVAHSDFISMLNNPALGMQLFMQGKLKVTGDPMLAMKLQKLFALA